MAYLISSIIFNVTVLTMAVLIVPALVTMIFLSAVKIRVGLMKESDGKPNICKGYRKLIVIFLTGNLTK